MSTPIPVSTLEKFSSFGDLLRYLRRRVGATQTELAIAVGYSTGQISRLEQNLRLPDIPTIQARFVPALDLEDEPKAVAQLLDLAAKVRREDSPSPGLCPYKGLNYFDESDADLFVGREVLTTKLVERVLSMTVRDSFEKRRFLAIVGASGSGKSSLVRAGLIPALRWNKQSADWHVYIFTPTVHPLESLATSLTHESGSMITTTTLMDDLARESRSLQLFVKQRLQAENHAHVLLIVDQFEELFALCRLEAERFAFINNLLTTASEAAGQITIVVTLRADFYAHCANYPELREALAKNQEYIGAMNKEELCRAIEEPARRGRWELEPGLVDLLLHDVGQEPGALPLLSHALLETWQRRRGRILTLSGYASSGGVRGAIAETAETVFADQFTQAQQAIARRIFLRLTELSDETSTADTRRRAKLNELILKPEERIATQAVLKALADARLITTSEDFAEVAHEALIREWPTLRNWLEDNREGLRLHRQLTEATQEWMDQDRAQDLLYRGARLAQAREYAASHEEELNLSEREFIAASTDHSEREIAERELQRQRELDSIRKLAETEKQSAIRLKIRNRVITSIGILAILLAVVANIFRVHSQADFTRSEAQRLALEANNLMLNNGDSSLVALLSIRSLKMQYTPAGDAVLTSLTGFETPPREFKGHTDFIYGVAISPDGTYLATGSVDQTIRLWDIATGKTVGILKGHTNAIEAVVFSPDGKTLLSSSDDGTARLWDVTTGQTIRVFSTSTVMGYAAFSPDGNFFVAAYADATGRIWDVTTGKTVHILTGHTKGLARVAYSPDGNYVLTGSGDDTARLWDTATGQQVQVFPGHTHGVSAVAFSPDGKYIATGDDPMVRLWDIATGQVVRDFSGHQAWVSGIRFSPDGQFLLTGSGDRTARLWDVATGQLIRILGGNTAVVQDVTFSPDGRLAVTAGDDKIAKVWSLQTFPGGMQFAGHNGRIWQASFSPDGKKIVTANEDFTARVWDVVTGQTLSGLSGHTAPVRGAIFSPDGKMVLTTSEDTTARLWDVTSGKELRRFAGHMDTVYRAAFSPDGTYLITTGWDGTARVWDTQSGKTLLIYRGQSPSPVNRIAFSPNGKTVVTSSDDGTARLWDPLTCQDLMVFKGHTDIATGVAFSPEGKYLVTSSRDSSVRLWGVATGKELRRFTGHIGYVYGAAFSPDGKYILSGGADGTARLWDVKTGKEVRRFTGHTDEVREVNFSPDGKYILTASNDGTARLWLTDYHDTIRAVCAVLTRDLTPEERVQFGIPDQKPTCSNLPPAKDN